MAESSPRAKKLAAHEFFALHSGLIIGLLVALPALAQPALQPLSPTHCGHGHQPPCPPPPKPPPPVTLSITFNPAAPTIPDYTPVGSLIAQIVVTVSDGSRFTGSLGFAAPFSNGGGVCAISGSEIVLGANPPDGVVNCTITATQ